MLQIIQISITPPTAGSRCMRIKKRPYKEWPDLEASKKILPDSSASSLSLRLVIFNRLMFLAGCQALASKSLLVALLHLDVASL